METIIQPLPTVSTTVQSTQIKDNPEIKFLPNSIVLYQASPTLREYKKLYLSVVNQPLAVLLKVTRALENLDNYVFLNNGTLFKQTGACELR
jgi:hypothetical protein